MLACVISADDAFAAGLSACVAPLVLDVARTSEPSKATAGATAQGRSLPGVVLQVSDVS